MDWKPIETAPKDVPFIALNSDREVWCARLVDGRLQFRTNGRYEPTKRTSVDVDGRRLWDVDDEFAKQNEAWTNQWCLWSRLYEFAPTHWMELPAPPAQPPMDR